jgi:hypothetical protein
MAIPAPTTSAPDPVVRVKVRPVATGPIFSPGECGQCSTVKRKHTGLDHEWRPITEDVIRDTDRRLQRAAADGAPMARVSDLMASWDPALDAFTVERLLRPGYRALLAAYESTGKTYVALQMALSFVYPEQAGPVFGEFDVNEPLSVLYVDGEIGTGESLRRLRALAAELHVNLSDSDYLRLVTLDQRSLSLKEPDDVAYLTRQADQQRKAFPDRRVVLMLDSTDSLWGKGLWGEGAEAFDAVIRKVMDGRRDWLIVMVLVHTVKKPRDQKASYKVDLQDVLGNVTRQADVVILLDTNGNEFSLRAGVHKRPGRSQGILQRDEGGHAWRWTVELKNEDGDWPFKTPRNLVVQALLGGNRLSALDLSRTLDVAKSTAERMFDQLVKLGLADSEQEDRGQHSPVVYWLRTGQSDE